MVHPFYAFSETFKFAKRFDFGALEVLTHGFQSFLKGSFNGFARFQFAFQLVGIGFSKY